jgi:hypothetical protein
MYCAAVSHSGQILMIAPLLMDTNPVPPAENETELTGNASSPSGGAKRIGVAAG